MKKIIIFAAIIGIITSFVYAKGGCCSHHGGVLGCSGEGKTLCKDGTTSPSCTCDGDKKSEKKVSKKSKKEILVNDVDTVVERVCSKEIKVIDGDTIELEGKRFRLACVDTPESNYKGKTQYCLDNETDCGQLAKEALKNIIAEELNEVSEICCSWIKQDRYGRYLGWCDGGIETTIPFSKSINLDLVINGYAWFYDGGKECEMFKEPFIEAKKELRGLFNEDLGGFKEPKLWRKAKTND